MLVINTWPGGADDARTLVRNLGYSFRLAHTPVGWSHSMGEGANFLINQQGRVVASLHFKGSEDLRTAERLVKGWLRHGGRKLLASRS